jgi:hypothetical protein
LCSFGDREGFVLVFIISVGCFHVVVFMNRLIKLLKIIFYLMPGRYSCAVGDRDREREGVVCGGIHKQCGIISFFMAMFLNVWDTFLFLCGGIY